MTSKAARKAEAVQLRSVRQKYSAEIASLAGVIENAVKSLLSVEKKMAQEAIDIAGQDYETRHVLTFEPHGSNDSQVETDGFVTSPDFASILKTATEVLLEARRVAAHKPDPPELPYERAFCDSPSPSPTTLVPRRGCPE